MGVLFYVFDFDKFGWIFVVFFFSLVYKFVFWMVFGERYVGLGFGLCLVELIVMVLILLKSVNVFMVSVWGLIILGFLWIDLDSVR